MHQKKWTQRIFLIALIPALGRIGYSLYKLQRIEQRNQEVQQIQKVQQQITEDKVPTPSDTMEEAGKKFTAVMEQSETTTSPSYDVYTPVDTEHSLGKRGETYFIYSPKEKAERALEGVTAAYVLLVDDKDEGDVFQLIVAQKEGQWIALNADGDTVFSFPFDDITDQTRLILKDNTLKKAP